MKKKARQKKKLAKFAINLGSPVIENQVVGCLKQDQAFFVGFGKNLILSKVNTRFSSKT